MEQSRIPPRYFFDEGLFEQEQRTLFRRAWQFFCLRTDLKEDNDFVSGSVGGIPVVVQNFKGRLRAFHNVCSHRGSAIQTAAAGNRHLFCPYHGWVYGETGEPIGIPHNEAFYPVGPEEKKRLALKSFHVAACGQLVFVAIDPPLGLEQQLGEWFPLVSRIGESLDDISFRTEIPAACNWKFVVGNAFDDIHAQFVHPSASLDTSVYTRSEWQFHDYAKGGESPGRDYSRRHAQFTVWMDDTTVARNEAAWNPFVPSRAGAFDQYLHLFLYPNHIITSVQGYVYCIVRYTPVSAESCVMNYWLVPARPTDRASVVDPQFLYYQALGGLRVFEEDIGAVEVAQRGIRSVQTAGVLGRREDKLVSFERAYMDVMRSADA